MFDRLCEEFDIYQSVYLNWLVIVLPNMYPTLFGLFKAQYAMLDKSYWTPLSEEFSAFHPAVDILRTICDKTTPTEKLLITYQTFATVDQIISKSKPSRNRVPTSLDEVGNCRNPSICSVDTLSHLPGLDQLLPIIQFVVIRAGVMYLGAELAYIEQLALERLSLTGWWWSPPLSNDDYTAN
uniref:VPS9 domain-containing protein n=1 Tax=Trichobilharzia regenti TaxID=157069 RepID=A0AA85K9N8_TRIRE|nr:unnamed protein product [Trichobilharzia regenti]